MLWIDPDIIANSYFADEVVGAKKNAFRALRGLQKNGCFLLVADTIQ